ncbi:MAG: endonuclease/exonuclease/phosphatase family protein [Planctomycetota bacterium]
MAVLWSNDLAIAETGTFIDRYTPSDLRVVTYNPLFDTIFSEVSPTQAAKFERIVAALDPDILHLQEITASTRFTLQLMNTIAPLNNGNGWYAHKGRNNVTLSKYPLSMTATNTLPSGGRDQAISLVDLPDDQFDADFYFMNNHYVCCGGEDNDLIRQPHSDSIVNWLRDARTPGGFIDLPPGTPFAVVGDLNIVGASQPLDTLVDGNIINEALFGSDSPPDWDGSSLTDARPLHNGSLADDYTWRDDNQIFDPGRLDYVIYTDTTLDVGNQFVLNTVAMSNQERAATGLQEFDVTLDNVGATFDHLPVVVDFRIVAAADEDFNFDRLVDGTDLAVWESGFGLASDAARNQGDANGDLDVDGHDFLRWQQQIASSASPSTATIPEPATVVFLLIGAGIVLTGSRCDDRRLI